MNGNEKQKKSKWILNFNKFSLKKFPFQITSKLPIVYSSLLAKIRSIQSNDNILHVISIS